MSFFAKLLAFFKAFFTGKTKDTTPVLQYTSTRPCYFEMLFTTNVPHILENIFLSVDFDSFNECLRVNSAWNKLLNSQSFQKKARSVFQKEIPEYECKLWIASRNGKAKEVRRLLSNRMLDVDHVKAEWFKDATTPLSMAAKCGHLNVVILLLGRGADPNKATRSGWTPLHMGASRGDIGVIKMLIERGAVVNIADENGETPLLTAALYGHRKIFELLIKRGAESKKDNRGRDPLYHYQMSLQSY